MKRAGLLLAVIALLVVPLTAVAQEKWVRGEVTAVSGNSLTVKAAEGPMTFMFDESTDVVAPGGATATREAQKAGKEGATLAQIIKVGDGVEVHYRDMAGKLHATEIRGGISVTATAPAEVRKGSSASGIVTAVSAGSITIKSKDTEWTFTVDQKTAVIGRGIGAAARELEKKAAPQTITEFLKQNDEVRVNYTEAGGKRHADEIHVIRSAK